MIGNDPVKFFKDISEKYKYKLKCFRKPSHHIGKDFSCDKDVTLTLGTGSYFFKTLRDYKLMLSIKPKEYS
jgi:hypothetical protein